MFKKVKAIMMFVEDIHFAAKWYSELLSRKLVYLDVDIPVIELDDTSIWFHKADSKVSSGKAGTIAYWEVNDFHQAMSCALKNGGTLYRGPLEIEDNQAICQILDPFGNLFGLCGTVTFSGNIF